MHDTFNFCDKRCKAVETQVQGNGDVHCPAQETCRNGDCRTKENECNTALDCSFGDKCSRDLKGQSLREALPSRMFVLSLGEGTKTRI